MKTPQSKFIHPIIERNYELDSYREMTEKEKIEFMKERFNLSHGKGKRKKYKNKKK